MINFAALNGIEASFFLSTCLSPTAQASAVAPTCVCDDSETCAAPALNVWEAYVQSRLRPARTWRRVGTLRKTICNVTTTAARVARCAEAMDDPLFDPIWAPRPHRGHRGEPPRRNESLSVPSVCRVPRARDRRGRVPASLARVFLDTSVLVSAFASGGLCADAFEVVLFERHLVLGRSVLCELIPHDIPSTKP